MASIEKGKPDKKEEGISPLPDWLKKIREAEAGKKPEKMKAPSVPQRRPGTSPAEVAQINALKQSIGIETGEDQEQREKVVEKVLQEGGFAFTTHLTGKFIGTNENSFGYYTILDNRSQGRIRSHQKESDIPWQAIEKQFGPNNDLTSDRKTMAQHNVNEFIDIRREVKPVFKTEIIPGKKGFLGFGSTPDQKQRRVVGMEPVKHGEIVEGGNQENAVRFTYVLGKKNDYIDASGRPGKAVNFSFLLPESSAKDLEKQIGKDPAVIREVMERAVKEKILKDPSDWDKPVGDGDSMRPPYERWDNSSDGGRVYVQKEGQAPGWHEENVKTIKK